MLILGGRSRSRLIVIFVVLALAALIGGLAAAAAWHDARSDAWHPGASRTYRVVTSNPDMPQLPPGTLGPRNLADQVRGGSTTIRAATTVVVAYWDFEPDEGRGAETLSIAFVDDSFPDLFDFGLDQAELARMEAAGAVRFTRAADARQRGLIAADAIRLGGEERPLFAPLSIPGNSHVQVDLIAPVALLPDVVDEMTEIAPGRFVRVVRSSDGITYVKVAPGGGDAAAEDLRTALVDARGFEQAVELQPLNRIRLDAAPDGDTGSEEFVSGRAQEYYAALAMLGLSLFAATTSVTLLVRAMIERETQVFGILRAIGRTPAMLVRRLLLELATVAAAALVVATLLALVFGAAVFGLLGSNLSIGVFLPVFLLASTTALIVVVAAACAFCWPLFGRPAPDLLNGVAPSPAPGVGVGFLAVGLQAALCFSVVYATLFINEQLARAVATTQAFEQVWRVELDRPEEAAEMQARLRASPLVREAVVSGWAPYSSLGDMGGVTAGEGAAGADVIVTRLLVAGDDTTTVLPRRLLAGEALTPADAAACRVLANETLLERLDIRDPAQAVGRTFRVSHMSGIRECSVAGVVADTRMETARVALDPMLHMIAAPGAVGFTARYLLVEADPSMTAGRLHALTGRSGETALPTRIGELEARAYERERRLVAVLGFGSVLVFLMISATLASAVAMIVEERSTEIGIRRTLGFSWKSICLTLARPFAIVTVIGALLGTPLVVWAVLRWSQGLQQPVSIAPERLALALAIVLAPLVLALAANWARLRSISPATVLRSQ